MGLTKEFIVDAEFLDCDGIKHHRMIIVHDMTFCDALPFITETIDAFQDEYDWDYVSMERVQNGS